MPRLISIGLPSRPKQVRRTKTVILDGFKIKVTVNARMYYGTISGWNIKAIRSDKKVLVDRFHNGEGFKNMFDANEALDYVLEKIGFYI